MEAFKSNLEVSSIQKSTNVDASVVATPAVGDALPKEKTIKELLEEREIELKELE